MRTLNERIAESSALTDEQLADRLDRFLHIHTEEIQNDDKDTFHCHRYEPTPYRVLDTLSREFPLTPQDVLLDYGSGLGRLSFFCNHMFHCGAIGVEMVSGFHMRALQNQNHYRGVYKNRIQFVNTKAEDYDVPNNVTVIYCFNPFSTDIFRSVLRRIEESHARCRRRITLILYYPEDNTVFYIERHTSFQLIREIAACDDIAKDRRERFCIYELENF